MLFMRKQWNHIAGSKNPMHYFNGKVLPFKHDEEDNIIFKYVPHPYEIVWQQDYGIDLSKN